MSKYKYYTKPDFTIAEEELEYSRKYDLYYRPSTSDKSMIKDCFKNYNHLEINSTDCVLDLGANIGAFAYSISSKTHQIVCVEAEPFNFEVLDKNVQDHIVFEKIQAAVVSSEYKDQTITFVLNNSKNSACSGHIGNDKELRSKRYINLEVPVIKLCDLFIAYQPNIVKIDIEGGEYPLLDELLEYEVDQIGGEFHGMSKSNYENMIKSIDKLKSRYDIVWEEYEKVFGNECLYNFVARLK